MNWISVKDRLPKKGELVEAKGLRGASERSWFTGMSVGDFIGVANDAPLFARENESLSSGGGFGATHWQPLPPAPQEESYSLLITCPKCEFKELIFLKNQHEWKCTACLIAVEEAPMPGEWSGLWKREFIEIKSPEIPASILNSESFYDEEGELVQGFKDAEKSLDNMSGLSSENLGTMISQKLKPEAVNTLLTILRESGHKGEGNEYKIEDCVWCNRSNSMCRECKEADHRDNAHTPTESRCLGILCFHDPKPEPYKKLCYCGKEAVKIWRDFSGSLYRDIPICQEHMTKNPDYTIIPLEEEPEEKI